MDRLLCNYLEGDMNILFFITPKSEVVYVQEDASLYKALQLLTEKGFTSIPVISKSGKYIGTINSNDILGCIRDNFHLSMKEAADFPLKNVRRLRNNRAVKASCEVDDIIETIINQNFVPVVDDDNNFIGIITRKEIVKWMHNEYKKAHGGTE